MDGGIFRKKSSGRAPVTTPQSVTLVPVLNVSSCRQLPLATGARDVSIRGAVIRHDFEWLASALARADRPAQLKGNDDASVGDCQGNQEQRSRHPPTEKQLAAMGKLGKFNEELVKAGVMLAVEGLHPSSKGKRVTFAGSKKTVVDGSFAEMKELIAGFWLWQVKSMEEAIEWVRRCPNPLPDEETIIEIRPVFEADDFNEFTPELLQVSVPSRR